MPTIPNGWKPRPYQRDLYNSFGHGKAHQRAAAIWHRRAGKDSTVLNMTAREMFKRVGTYWHLFPEQAQARKAIWNGIDREGRRIIDQFLPPDVRKAERSQEMMIEVANGSTWQLAGSDNYDSLVGSNPVGVVFSEWSLAKPEAWDYIRPILAENDGWALFIYTPRGRNHGWDTYQRALRSKDWFCQLLTVDDTKVISHEAIEAEREAGMSEDKVQQEFWCSFEASNEMQFIPGDSVLDAMKRDAEQFPGDERVMAVDVAAGGADETVLAYRVGFDARTHPWQFWRLSDTMQIAAKIVEEYHKFRPDALFVDVGGIGKGVVDRIRQLGIPVVGVDGATSPSGTVADIKVANKRAECWAKARLWLKDGGVIPDDPLLASQLTDLEYDYNARNEVVLESKRDLRREGRGSPDRADALAYSFAYPVVTRALRDAMPDLGAHLKSKTYEQATGGNPFRR